jgi:predicted Zn-dependent peptidase
MVKWAEEKLGSIPPGEEVTPLTKPTGSGGEHYEGKEVEQVHFCLGGDAPGILDDRFHTVQVLNEILGGGMSSRLWHEVREQRGLAYSVGSYQAAYTPGGAFTIYGGTSQETWPQVREVIRQELDKMMQDGPTDEELARAKKSLSGSLVLGLEGTGSRMRRMSRIELAFRREIPLEETVGKINTVTRENLLALAQEIFPADRLTTTVIGPRS